MQATRSALPSSSSGIIANDKPSVGSGAGTGAGGGGPAAAAAVPTTASTRRLPNTTASLPIVYGSIAGYLGKKADELQTHEWTLFIRGPNQHDDHLSSVVISKVVFQLHPSFAQPIRELTEPPYEVTERGWGEFEAQIRIHWKDPTEQTTILNHTIKLYPQGTPAPNNSNALLQQSTEKPVLAEMYDEVVFTDPTESFFKSLTQITAVPVECKVDDKSSKQEDDKTSLWKKHLNDVYSDQEDFLALIGAQKFLQDELSKVKQRFQLVNDDITTVDQKLLLVQQQKQREAAAAAISGASNANAGGATSSSDGRKRTKKPRSTSQNKKGRTTSNTKTASAPAVTISTKSTTSTTGANKRKTTSTTTTTTTMSNKTTTAMTAAAAVSNVPTTTTGATVTATKPASTTTAAATTASSNNTTSTNNKGGNSNSTGVNIQAASSNAKK
jgi:YEATS domain-containing protein 4